MILEEKKIVVGKINRNKKKYKTVLEDDAGNLYELDGSTPYVPAGSNENSEVSEEDKNNSSTNLKDIKRKRLAKYGRKKQLTSVRLDTFSKNLKNQKFYERRGYVKLESIYYPLQSDSPFYCYELLL